jgi:peptide-methionine (R)-S-oxide reductase
LRAKALERTVVSHDSYRRLRRVTVKKVEKSDQEWKEELTREEYRVLRKGGTERAFTGEYYDTEKKGIYRCAACGNELFDSETKFKSGSGWPSFWAPVDQDHVEYHKDRKLMMERTEVRCAACGSHLGHVFNDGPPPTHKRYCINSVALDLDEEAEKAE